MSLFECSFTNWKEVNEAQVAVPGVENIFGLRRVWR